MILFISTVSVAALPLGMYAMMVWPSRLREVAVSVAPSP